MKKWFACYDNVDVHVQDKDGFTALIPASLSGVSDVVNELLMPENFDV